MNVVFRANEEMESVESRTAQELLSLRAEVKRLRIQNESMETHLLRKDKDNQELTQICDELIQRHGSVSCFWSSFFSKNQEF